MPQILSKNSTLDPVACRRTKIKVFSRLFLGSAGGVGSGLKSWGNGAFGTRRRSHVGGNDDFLTGDLGVFSQSGFPKMGRLGRLLWLGGLLGLLDYNNRSCFGTKRGGWVWRLGVCCVKGEAPFNS